MKTKTKALIMTSLLAFTILIARLHGINEEIKDENRQKLLEEIRVEKQQREAERKLAMSEVASNLKSNPKEAVKTAINNMTSYSDLVKMLGEPDEIDRRINGADLAVWNIGDITVHVSEKRDGTTDVYAFEGVVKNNIARREFNRMLLN